MKKTREPAQYSDLNRRFHRQLTEPCPNAFLKSEIEQLWNKVWRTRTQSLFQMIPGRIGDATKEHEQILNAVIEGKPQRLQAALMAHREQTLAHWKGLAASAASATTAKRSGSA